MAAGDLCTIEDIKNEDLLLAGVDTYDDAMGLKITQISTELLKKQKSDADPDDLKMCCVYGVLAWLEENKVTDYKGEVRSESEGDTSVSYNTRDSPLFQKQSYTEKYLIYRARVLPMVIPIKSTKPVGD